MDPNSPEAMAPALGEWNPQPTPKQGPALGYMGDYLKTLWGGPSWAEKAQAQDDKNLAQGFDPQGTMDLMKDMAWGAIFAGPNSKTANLDKLQHANWMWGQGKDWGSIFDRTGWFKGRDNLWRYVIPDQKAGLLHGAADKLGNKLDHPELFKAYPNLENQKLTYDQPEGRGYYDPVSDEIDMPYTTPVSSGVTAPNKGLLAHEVQHKVQQQAGMNRGINPNVFYDFLRKDNPSRPIGDIDRAAKQAYLSHGGEVEARNVQKLATQPEYFAKKPPWETEDTPRIEQILGPKIGEPGAIASSDDFINALRQHYRDYRNISSPLFKGQKNPKIIDASWVNK